MVENLFGQLQLDDDPALPSTQGPFASVALEQGIDRLLDYSIPDRLVKLLHEGQLVKVPLGRNNKPAKGYVISIHDKTSYPKIKPLTAIEDERVLVAGKLMELARWMSRYYVTPLGVVLDCVIPSAVKKQIGIGYSKMVRLVKPREFVQEVLEKTKAPKRRAILARLLLLEPDQSIELIKLASESGTKSATVRKLVNMGLISIASQVDFLRLTADMKGTAGDEAYLQLNEEQAKVFAEMAPKLNTGFSVSLLHGVTGSGKTEIYLQCIREVVNQGKQAIVLVPEIALTPQTVGRFTARFKRVAILHSGLTSTERHRYWQQISLGLADVVVGARSAIFAPVPNLGIVVVDEEHESSYKQDTAPRYHARDVSIKRAQLEQVPVVLGSATPSLETYHRVTREEQSDEATKRQSDKGKDKDNVQSQNVSGFDRVAARDGVGTVGVLGNKADAGLTPLRRSVASSLRRSPYQLLPMPSRVRGLQLPHIEVVDMKVAGRFRRGVHLLSERLEHLLRTTIDAKHQAILLLNRRGYSNFVYCVSCGNVVSCKYCDTTMTYHRAAATHPKDASAAEGIHTGSLHCHYCLAVNPLPANCPVCQKKLSLFGLGTQRVEEEIQRKFPDLRYARVDSDSMRSSKDYEETLRRFGNNEIQVLLGTQMIAKGLDYPNVTLVGIVSGDTALALPDFRASERTFQLITQVAGRAGRGDSPGRVILQTFMPDDPTIQAAIKQDYVRFATTELKHRREVGLPPFARMVRIVLRDQEQEKLFKLSEDLGAALSEEAAKQGDAVKLKGPMPCAISRIAGYYRNQIVMFSAEASRLQKILAAVREKGALSKTDRIAVDVDPTSLL